MILLLLCLLILLILVLLNYHGEIAYIKKYSISSEFMFLCYIPYSLWTILNSIFRIRKISKFIGRLLSKMFISWRVFKLKKINHPSFTHPGGIVKKKNSGEKWRVLPSENYSMDCKISIERVYDLERISYVNERCISLYEFKEEWTVVTDDEIEWNNIK